LSPQQERDPYALPASIEAARPQPQSQPQRQKEADPYALPPGFEDHDKDPYALPPGFEEPKNQWRGGRAAYKSGGKVGTKDIEPLISALMNKAKQAKKVSNKATEPLLNAKDDAIASALAVAQKAI